MKEEKRESFKERIYRNLDIEPDIMPRESFVEIRGRECVMIRGAGRILLYTPNEIKVERGDGEISVVGETLICTSYYLGAVGIEGRIKGVNFRSEGEDE